MKALMYVAKNKVEVMDIPEPQVRPGTVKIRVDYCALCATDVHIVSDGLYGVPTPFGIGHEGSGEIIELGEGAAEAGWKLGDRVAVASGGPCGICDQCKRGNDIFCQRLMPAFPMCAEFSTPKLNMIFKIPDGKPTKDYCIAEPCASAMQGIDLADIKIGDNVAISGVGGIGAILLNMILLKGATRVTAIDPVPDKRDRALAMGADYVIDPTSEDIVARAKEITDGRGFNVVIEASGVPVAAPPVLKMIANKGKAVYFAVYPMDYELPVNLYELYTQEISMQTVYTSIYNYPRVMELIPKLQLDKIFGPEKTMDEAAEAFELYRSSKYPKVVVKCSNI